MAGPVWYGLPGGRERLAGPARWGLPGGMAFRDLPVRTPGFELAKLGPGAAVLGGPVEDFPASFPCNFPSGKLAGKSLGSSVGSCASCRAVRERPADAPQVARGWPASGQKRGECVFWENCWSIRQRVYAVESPYRGAALQAMTPSPHLPATLRMGTGSIGARCSRDACIRWSNDQLFPGITHSRSD